MPYHYDDNRILGFSQTHLSGTGWVDYGNVQIIPYADGKYRDDCSYFDKKTEKASLGYYSVPDAISCSWGLRAIGVRLRLGG